MGRIRKQLHGEHGGKAASVNGDRQRTTSTTHHAHLVEQDAARMERHAARIKARRKQ